jgi:signal transduction histidine kinase
VLTNLIGNAIKYGEGRPIDVVLSRAGERARLQVRDQGIGIDKEDQARVFERFERAVSHQRFGGFGLGLWIVRYLIEALKGTVRVDSQPGVGSTFTVELPLVENMV